MTNKLRFSKKCLPAAIAACFMAEAVPVMAQSADVVLEEIVVTARKRDESILKVPVTASVLSGDTLDQYAVSDVKGIADKTPGLNFSSGPLASGVLVSMRGIGTGTNNPAIDQSVALVADGMQLTQGLAFQAATFDMAQVEVLKGPQALFFGKAAPAGAIAIRSADPTDEVEFSLRGGYESEAEGVLGELIVSGPVTDTFGLRLAAQFSESDGYFQNEAQLANHPIFGNLGAAPVTEKDFPNRESTLVRGTALWDITDNLSARFKVNYAEMETQGNGGEPQLVSCPEGTGSFFGALVTPAIPGVEPLSFIGGEDCKLDNTQNFAYMDPAAFPEIINNGVPFSDLEQHFETLELSYDFGNDLTLTSVTGYYDVEQVSLMNLSITTEVGPPMANQGVMERDDLTQEFRLTSNYGGSVNYMAGIFYQDGETNYLSHLPLNQTYIPFGAPPVPALAKLDHTVETNTKSVFGQVLWQLTPEFELGLGTRWTDEEREHGVEDYMFGTLSAPMPVNLSVSEISSDNWSPELSLTYTPTDDLTLYGNLKQAYKSGSFDIGGQVSDDGDNSFEDEKITGGEFGLKMRSVDGSLALNGAAYFYSYDDLQVETSIFDPVSGAVGVKTTNAASAEIYGIDVDANYFVPGVEGLTLFGAFNWNIAEYDEFDDAQCWKGQTIAEGCNQGPLTDADGNPLTPDAYGAQDLSGEPLLRAPEWMANVGFDYERSVFNSMTLRVGSNLSYSDSYSASSLNHPDAYQDSYVKTSATIGLIGANDRWKVEAIGDNLNDELVYGNCGPRGYAETIMMGQSEQLAQTGTAAGGPLGQLETACWVEQGRSLWLRLTVNFF